MMHDDDPEAANNEEEQQTEILVGEEDDKSMGVALEAEVVEERDLQREVQRRMDLITVEATSVRISFAKTGGKAPGALPSTRKNKSAVFLFAMLMAVLVVGAAIGSTRLRSNKKKDSTNSLPPALAIPSQPSDEPHSISEWIDIFTPLSGEEALVDESSPQYKALWWIVHDDPAQMTKLILIHDESESSLTLILERYVLAVLYFATDGPNWVFQHDFLGNTSICAWQVSIKQGVLCNEEGLVARLLLETNQLNGTLPSELYVLSSIVDLSFVDNSLQGTIPSSIGTLTRLTRLQIGENLLSGSFPESFADLRELEWLYMDDNELTGTVPQIRSIEVMAIGINFLTGTLPDNALLFENLREIWLDWNMISGAIPECLFSPTLKRLSLWKNQLNGHLLDSKLGSLVELIYLDLSENYLTGTLPTEIGSLGVKLENLYLDSNAFRGTIPSQMGLLTRLDILWLSKNQLSGAVPEELASLASAASLKFFDNNLTGSLDMIFCNQTSFFVKLDADCGGVAPEVECSCCTTCCDSSSGGDCKINLETFCAVEKSKFVNEDGPYYRESGGTVCECTSSENKTTTLSCMDTKCQSCNRNETVCSMNEMYQFRYAEDGFWDIFEATYQYVVGRNDTVTLEIARKPDFTYICEIAVNGQACNSCYFATCQDGFSGLHVQCDNVVGAGYIDLCDEKRADDDGPLAVFSLQDPAFLEGCPPRIYNFLQ